MVALGLALLLAWLLFGWHPQAPSHQLLDAQAPAATGGDFTLRSAAGPVRLEDFRGKLVLLYFGYTACPDVCPTNLAMLGMALRALRPEEREQVRVIFVSVDPERDELAHLETYAAYFHPEIIGATGGDTQLRDLARRYGAVYRVSEDPGSAMGYLIDHSANTYLIDTMGRLRKVLGHATPAEQIVATLRGYLAHGQP